MTVQEYRYRLERALEGCSPEEIENAVEYYSELIEESDNPGEQMEKLGTPEELAERIKRESGWIQPSDGMPSGGRDIPPQSFSGAQQSAGSSGGVAARIIALVCTSPLWLSAFIVLASLFIVIWSVYVIFPSGAVSALISSFVEMKTYSAYGVLLLMAMLAFAGLTLLLANPAVNLTRLTSYGISGFAKMLFAPAAKHGSFKWKAMNKLIAIVGAGLLAAGLVGGGIVYAFAHPTADKYAAKLDLTSEEYELSASAQTVKMDISIGDVTVKKSEDGKAKLKVVNIEKEDLTVEDGNSISITYSIKDEFEDHFNFDLFGIKSSSQMNSRFELYLPEKKYDDITLDADLGSLKLSDLTADILNVTADCGEIKINDTDVSTLIVKESLGEVELNNVAADSADIHNDCGAVEMKAVAVTNELKGEISLGAGEFEDVTVGTLDIQLDCGDFKFNGMITKSGNIRLDLGEADIKLVGQGYNVHADADTGSAKVDDSLKSGSILVEVHDDCGDVSVKAA